MVPVGEGLEVGVAGGDFSLQKNRKRFQKSPLVMEPVGESWCGCPSWGGGGGGGV